MFDRLLKKVLLVVLIVMSLCIAGCTKKDSEVSKNESGNEIVIGFSQLGAESDWRSANTESMKSTFCKENGYNLLFDDGQQKQTNQMMAIRTFIQQ